MFSENKNEFDFFLMSAPEEDDYVNYKKSDQNHFYFYKQKNGQVFYYLEQDRNKHYIENNYLGYPAESAFSSTNENLIKYNFPHNITGAKKILEITSSRGHTHQNKIPQAGAPYLNIPFNPLCYTPINPNKIYQSSTCH